MGIIAVFGGTFNPIHRGHCEIIEEIQSLDDVEKVIVIPTKIPPHKTVDFMADENDRMEMCRLATSGFSKVEVSDIELKREGKSYTVDTLEAISKLYPDKRLAITIGADMVVSFENWKEYNKILQLASVITFSRVTTDPSQYLAGLKKLGEWGAELLILERMITDISSSKVRELAFCRKDFSEFLPQNVYNYIVDKGLYGDR